MKKLFLGILTLIIITISCNLDDDGYSLSKMWVSFGIIEQNENTDIGFYIKLDNGDYIHPVVTNIHFRHFKDSDRVLVNYSILDDVVISDEYNEYNVKINSMRGILMKGIIDITPEIEDSIGNDPLIVKDVWISNNLLNFEINYWGSDEIHFINLVKQPGELTEDDMPFELELRHNNNDDPEHFQYNAFVSFDLSSLQLSTLDSVSFKITANEYGDDLYEDEGIYVYGDN